MRDGLRAQSRRIAALVVGLGASLSLAVAGCSDDGGSRGSAALAATPAAPSAAPAAPTAAPAAASPASPAPVASAATPAFVWAPVPVDVPSGPLVELPPGYLANGGDPVHVPMRFEADRFTDRPPSQVPPLLKLVTWNVEWGKRTQEVIDLLALDPELADADLLVLTEVPRNDPESNPPGVNLARELAQLLRMDYVFAVEWDRRLEVANGGEHGTAILSKYPLGNLRHLRHAPAYDHYGNLDRIGGRHTLAVDALIDGRPLGIYGVHLATRDLGPDRAAQGAEVLADTLLPGRPAAQVVAGDFNTWTCNPLRHDCTVPPAAETVIREMFFAGWQDGTAGFTGFTQMGLGVLPQRLDWIFCRGVQSLPGRAIPTRASDHHPLYTELSPPQ